MEQIEQVTDGLTIAAAWEQVKAVINLKYPRDKHTGSANHLLREAIKSLVYRFKHQPDAHIQGMEISTKRTTLRAWAGVGSDRQLKRILDQVEEIQVKSRGNGVITYTLNFAPVLGFDPAEAKAKQRHANSRARASNLAKVRRYRESKKAIERAVDAQIVSRFVESQESAVSRAWAAGTIAMHEQGKCDPDNAVSRAWAAGLILGHQVTCCA